MSTPPRSKVIPAVFSVGYALIGGYFLASKTDLAVLDHVGIVLLFILSGTRVGELVYGRD